MIKTLLTNPILQRAYFIIRTFVHITIGMALLTGLLTSAIAAWKIFE